MRAQVARRKPLKEESIENLLNLLVQLTPPISNVHLISSACRNSWINFMHVVSRNKFIWLVKQHEVENPYITTKTLIPYFDDDRYF